MEFNINKYRVIHIWKRNLEFQYQINDGWVKSIEEERDLGVLMFKGLKFSIKCLLTKNKTNLMLCIIHKRISCTLLIIKTIYVRPHLVYFIQFWTPINVDMGVQRRTTKMIQILRNLSYEEILKSLGMFV